MDGFPVAPAAVPHGFFLRPSEMIGEGSEAAAQTVQADLREIVCGTDPVDLPPHAVAERAYITVVILQDFQKPNRISRTASTSKPTLSSTFGKENPQNNTNSHAVSFPQNSISLPVIPERISFFFSSSMEPAKYSSVNVRASAIRSGRCSVSQNSISKLPIPRSAQFPT